MSDSGGRRIMREYTLKLDYIKPCTPEFLEKMKALRQRTGAIHNRKAEAGSRWKSRQYGQSSDW